MAKGRSGATAVQGRRRQQETGDTPRACVRLSHGESSRLGGSPLKKMDPSWHTGNQAVDDQHQRTVAAPAWRRPVPAAATL